MMRILMVTPGRLPVPAVRGGAVETLIELLLKYNDQYHNSDITVVSAYDEVAVEKSKEYQHSEFYFIKRNRLGEIAMKKHLLPYRFFDYCFSKKTGYFLQKKKLSFDVIIIQNELVNGWAIKPYIQGSYIYHAHNDTLNSNNKRDVDFLRSCDKVIAISDYLAACFCNKAGLRQVMTVYNGIDTEIFDKELHQETRLRLRRQYGIEPDESLIVFAGRLVPEKGIEVLLEAVKRISEEQKVKLLIIGASFFKESGENDFVKHLKELSVPVKKRIIFSGYVDYADMPSYYSMADIGCIPSLWEEPFGLAVVEQMAMELPIIATDAGAISEIVDVSCGYLFHRDSQLSGKIAEAVTDLCTYKEKRKIMGLAGRKKVMELFSQKLFCEKWFQMVTGRSGNGAML